MLCRLRCVIACRRISTLSSKPVITGNYGERAGYRPDNGHHLHPLPSGQAFSGRRDGLKFKTNRRLDHSRPLENAAVYGCTDNGFLAQKGRPPACTFIRIAPASTRCSSAGASKSIIMVLLSPASVHRRWQRVLMLMSWHTVLYSCRC